jgi:hypothetical protein
MNQGEFAKIVAAEEALLPEQRGKAIDMAEGMNDEQRAQFYEDLKQASRERREDFASQVDALGHLQALAQEGGEKVRTAEHEKRASDEKREQEEGLENIAKRIDQL